MSKFANLYQHVKQLGLVNHNLTQPRLGNPDDLELVHCANYLDDLWHNNLEEKALRRIGLPWSEPLIARTFGLFRTSVFVLGIASGFFLNRGYNLVKYSRK